MRQLIYKCFPIKCIPNECSPPYQDLEYSAGWEDYKNMGIALIGTWASWKLPGKRLSAFTAENLEEFRKLADLSEMTLGFNSLSFDDALIRTFGIELASDRDLLREIIAETVNPKLSTQAKKYTEYTELIARYPIAAEYSLSALALANLPSVQIAKESVSVLWQKQRYQEAIRSCLHQVLLIKKLDALHRRERLFDPVCGRPVSHKFPIPVPTPSLFCKLVAFALGAFWRKDGQYAYLRSFADYEHYAFLCHQYSQ